ncbi:hypothetical protein [Streptomyces alanosinicus]|uniref:Integral membrane protein n=1 Tax=Streptomyces alanosinicus TaxID=68171 RepID=A0A918YPP0_9ACTN|nr:hypothetical protein [Streptomyces alanosinicus]GHE10754.1 hypothetical protein GCM10010339_67960 [Streptomyces alanosinicus]
MPDRSLRLLTFPPRPAQGGERGAVVLRDRPASPPEAPGGHTGRGGRGADGSGAGQQDGGQQGGQQEDNPFAPPPEGAPDRPWQPRHPEGSHGQGSGPAGGSPWGSQWSDRQPGRSPGGFGERPGGGPQGPGGPAGPGMRWDPTDPVQRRARYALLSGMWAVFFALFSWPYVSLLLGVLALYWGISALRAKPRGTGPDNPTPPGAGRPQTTAAVGGLLTASLALVLVASTFTVQFVYRDYYTCVNDALTHEAKQSCDQLLPKQLRGVLGVDDS